MYVNCKLQLTYTYNFEGSPSFILANKQNTLKKELVEIDLGHFWELIIEEGDAVGRH